MVRFEPNWPRRLLMGQLVWFLCWLTATALCALLVPNPAGHGTHQDLGLPPCACAFFYHRLCPGCGLTTAFAATVHGDIGAAVHAHPFGPFLYLAWTASALACAYGYWRHMRFNTDSRGMSVALALLIVAFLGFGMYRFAAQPLTDAQWQALIPRPENRPLLSRLLPVPAGQPR